MSAAKVNEGLRKRDKPLVKVFDGLFGYDYFLAHRSVDGKAYAKALYNELTSQGNGLDCFLDVNHYGVGHSLTAMQTRALGKTTRLIVIVTPHAHDADARYLRGEVEEFKARHSSGLIIIIGSDRTLFGEENKNSPLLALLPELRDKIHVMEPDEALESGVPTKNAIAKLLNDFTEERRSGRRMRWIQRTMVVLVLLLLTTLWFAWRSNVERGNAENAMNRAIGEEAKALSAAKSANLRLADVNWQLANQARGEHFSNKQASLVDATWHLLGAAEAMENAGDKEGAECAAFAADFAGRPLVAAGAPYAERATLTGILGLAPADFQGEAQKPEAILLNEGLAGPEIPQPWDRQLELGEDGLLRQKVIEAEGSVFIGQPIRHEEDAGRRNPKTELERSFSVDGSRIITWRSNGGTVRLWDAATGASIGKPMGHQGALYALRQHADGKRLLTLSGVGDDDVSLRLWDAHSGEALGKEMVVDGGIFGVAFSRDGSRIFALNSEGMLYLWSTQRCELEGKPIVHPGMHTAAECPDGSKILTWGDAAARQWEVATGEQIGADIGHVVEASPGNFTVTEQAEQAEPGQKLGFSLEGAAYSPDGKQFVTYQGLVARLWNAKDSKEVGAPLVHPKALSGACFSPDGKLLLTWGYPDLVQFWSVATGEPWGRSIQHPAGPTECDYDEVYARFAADGLHLITSSGRGMRKWDVGKESRLQAEVRNEAGVRGGEFSPDGKRILVWSSDNEVRQYKAGTATMETPAIITPGGLKGACYRGDGARILTWGEDGTARQWEAADGAAVPGIMRHQVASADQKAKAVEGAVYDPSGTRILTWCSDSFGSGPGRLWDAASGSPIGEEMKIWRGAFGRNGESFLTWDETTISRRNLRTGELLGERIALQPISVVSFSQDGQQFLSAGQEHREVEQWTWADGVEHKTKIPQSEIAMGAIYSPNGRHILVWNQRREIRQWDSQSGQSYGPSMLHPVTQMEEDGDPGMAYSPDGRWILTWGGRAALLWSSRDGYLAARFPHERVISACFDRDGQRILTTGGKEAKVWDLTFDTTLTSAERKLEFQVRSATRLTKDGRLEFLNEEEWLKKRDEWAAVLAKRKK